MLTWTQGDKTPVTTDEIDWTLFDPGRVDHVRDRFLGFALEQGTCTRGMVAGALVTFHDKGQLSGRGRGGRSSAPVDIRAVVTAKGMVDATALAHLEAKRAFTGAIRSAYADGATATSLHQELGLSLSRVNQLVAGARS